MVNALTWVRWMLWHGFIHAKRVMLSRPAPMCTILSSLGGSKTLLVPQGFVLPTWHQASWENASYISREGTPYEPGSRHSLKRCGTLSTQCLTHTLRGEPSSALIPSVTPYPKVHDIVLFGWLEGSLSPSRFCSSHVTPSLVGKGLIHIKEWHPLWTKLWPLT